MPHHIEDVSTAQLVDRLARLRGISQQHAVRLAVTAELDRLAGEMALQERWPGLRRRHPLPPPSGETAA